MFEAAAECLYLLGAEWRLLKPLDFLSVGVDHPEELSGSRHSTERESGFKKRSVSNRERSASSLHTLCSCFQKLILVERHITLRLESTKTADKTSYLMAAGQREVKLKAAALLL